MPSSGLTLSERITLEKKPRKKVFKASDYATPNKGSLNPNRITPENLAKKEWIHTGGGWFVNKRTGVRKARTSSGKWAYFKPKKGG